MIHQHKLELTPEDIIKFVNSFNSLAQIPNDAKVSAVVAGMLSQTLLPSDVTGVLIEWDEVEMGPKK